MEIRAKQSDQSEDGLLMGSPGNGGIAGVMAGSGGKGRLGS